MAAYYNEIDPYAAAWLRNLIAAGHIADGVVDERSIEDVYPSDLAGFTQCHFFAGIGAWSHALRRAGWADDRPVWTGSCPCQPFSDAGKGAGLADERHLWPAWLHLIRQRRPGRIYGEQVASRDALGWWDVVRDDLEDARYASGAFDLCAAGVGAPHIRQRLFWLADADEGRGGRHAGTVSSTQGRAQRTVRRLADSAQSRRETRSSSLLGDAGDAGDEGLAQCLRFPGVPGRASSDDARQAAVGTGVHAGSGIVVHAELHDGPGRSGEANGDGPLESDRSGSPRRFWGACDWIDCRDGKRRPVEPGTFPLAHGASARMGRLRAYGNAIVAPLATEFILATLKD